MICHEETPVSAWYSNNGTLVIQHLKSGSSHVYESYDTADGAAQATYELNLMQQMLDIQAMVLSWVRVDSAEDVAWQLSKSRKSVGRLFGWLRELASHGWAMQEAVQELLDSKSVHRLNLLHKRHLRGEVCATNELRNIGWRDPLCQLEQDLLDLELTQYVEYFA